MVSPGHQPSSYATMPDMKAAFDRARQMVQDGKGQETAEFLDNDQGRISKPRMKAADLLPKRGAM